MRFQFLGHSLSDTQIRVFLKSVLGNLLLIHTFGRKTVCFLTPNESMTGITDPVRLKLYIFKITAACKPCHRVHRMYMPGYSFPFSILPRKQSKPCTSQFVIYNQPPLPLLVSPHRELEIRNVALPPSSPGPFCCESGIARHPSH